MSAFRTGYFILVFAFDFQDNFFPAVAEKGDFVGCQGDLSLEPELFG